MLSLSFPFPIPHRQAGVWIGSPLSSRPLCSGTEIEAQLLAITPSSGAGAPPEGTCCSFRQRKRNYSWQLFFRGLFNEVTAPRHAPYDPLSPVESIHPHWKRAVYYIGQKTEKSRGILRLRHPLLN